MRCTAASRSSPLASSRGAIRSSKAAADAHKARAPCCIPIVASACAWDRTADFSASNSSSSATDRLAFAMFGLLEFVSGEADAVTAAGEGTETT